MGDIYSYVKDNQPYFQKRSSRVIEWSHFLPWLIFMAAMILVSAFTAINFLKPTKMKIVSPIGQDNNLITPTAEISPSVVTQEPTATPTLFIPTPTIFLPSPTPIISLKKKEYKIAIFGDSMVDTMEENLPYLEKSLKEKYVGTKFLLYNYGIGAQNIADGLARFNKPFVNGKRSYPSIPQLKPDILIIGSFAYNPFSPYDLKKYRSTLEKLISEAKKLTPQVYVLVEISPIKTGFGQGPKGVNWDKNTAYEHATHIIEQLSTSLNLAGSLKVPVIDAFTPSWTNSEKEGNKKYVNVDDGIHPSLLGHQFMADLIVSVIKPD